MTKPAAAVEQGGVRAHREGTRNASGNHRSSSKGPRSAARGGVRGSTEEEPERGRAIKGIRFALLREEWNLTADDRTKVSEVQRSKRSLYRAYLLKEALAHLLGYQQAGRARGALKEWLGWASRSRLRPFVRVARTIGKYRDGVLAYIDCRLTNGPVEGINNRMRMVAWRAFGFPSAEALIAMIFLCCSKIDLALALPGFRNPLGV